MKFKNYGHKAKLRSIVLCLVLISSLFSCKQDKPKYSFFTAGHTYGDPDNPHHGLHYPFVEYIPTLNSYPNMKFGFLTGDVVFKSKEDYWDSARADMNRLNMPTFIAAGNHDISPEFIEQFEEYYYSFKHDGDLFIVLTPGLDLWNISGVQLEFLKTTLELNQDSAKNIFIFLHELIWWSPESEFGNVKVNSFANYPGSTNYESTVKPLLTSYSNKFVIYAGDLGCIDKVSPCMYHRFENITLIASGMGGGIRDNIIITDVYKDSVYHRLHAINGEDHESMGEIEDYSLEYFLDD